MTVETTSLSVDESGSLQESFTPAIPLSMVCEHKDCNDSDGQDYKRKKAPKGWEGEPIFLCKKHSTGYEPFNKEV